MARRGSSCRKTLGTARGVELSRRRPESTRAGSSQLKTHRADAASRDDSSGTELARAALVDAGAARGDAKA